MACQRETWIDGCRGLLILLVVAGHAIGGAVHLVPEGTFSRAVADYAFKFIYSFHMPAFFFVAGITFGLGRQRSFLDFLRHKARRLLVPYFVFGVLSGLMYLAMADVFNSSVANHATDAYYAAKSGVAWWVPFIGLLHGGGWPNGQGFIANSVLWFLPCLFTVELTYFLLDKALRNRTGQLMVAVLLLVAVYPLKRLLPADLPWGLSRLPYFLPFFIFGLWAPSRIGAGTRAYVIGAILLLVLVGGVIATPNAWNASRTWGWSLAFTGLAIIGTMSIFLLGRRVDWRMTRACGVASMTIMLLHKFLVVFLELKVPFLRIMICAGGARMAVAIIAIVAFSMLACLFADWLLRHYAPWAVGLRRRNAEKQEGAGTRSGDGRG